MLKMNVTHKVEMLETGKVVEFMIRDEIRPDGVKFDWSSWKEVDDPSDTSQRYFNENLAGLTAADTVRLYINSLGGSVKEALGIYSALRRCPAKVEAYIDGYAASAASIVAMAADKVIMPRNTCMMIHNAAWATYGNPSELRKSADDLEIINTAAISSYTARAGDKLPESELRQMLDAETWLSADDCIKYGLADEYGDTDADTAQMAQTYAAAASAAGETVRAYGKPPEYLAAACLAAAAQSVADGLQKSPTTPPPAPKAAQTPAPTETPKSSIFKLLETMTKE